MSLLDEVDRALLAIGRSSNRVSSEQMRHHEEVLSQFIAAEDEEDDSYATDDDYDEDYVPVDDGEVSDIENEIEVEEELPENEDIYEVGWDEANEQEPSVSNLASGVNRLLGEKERYYECKIDKMLWKKEPPAPRVRHWNRFTSTSTRPVGPAHRFLPNPVSIFRDIMSPEIVDIIVRQTNRKAGEVIKAWNEANPTCKPNEWKPTDEMEMYGRDFILELAEQVTIPHMERRAANPRVYGRPGIKTAMQKFNVFYVSIYTNIQVRTEISI